MKYAKAVDANQAEIVKLLRLSGFAVFDCHTLGKGFPDLCVSFNNVTYLIEIKADRQGRLTPPEQKFRISWKAPIFYCYSEPQLLDWIEKIKKDIDECIHGERIGICVLCGDFGKCSVVWCKKCDAGTWHKDINGQCLRCGEVK